MAISKDIKKKLIDQYVTDLSGAANAVIVQQSGITVPTASAVRKSIATAQGKYVVVRKRLFLRALKEAGLPEVAMNDLPGSIILITADNEADAFGPMKIINKAVKELKKKEEEKMSYTFLGGWFEKVWKDGTYVSELANLPSKEELISKLLFMLKYPMQGLASVVDQIAKKNAKAESGGTADIPIASTKDERIGIEEVITPEVEAIPAVVTETVAPKETVVPETTTPTEEANG